MRGYWFLFYTMPAPTVKIPWMSFTSLALQHNKRASQTTLITQQKHHQSSVQRSDIGQTLGATFCGIGSGIKTLAGLKPVISTSVLSMKCFMQQTAELWTRWGSFRDASALPINLFNKQNYIYKAGSQAEMKLQYLYNPFRYVFILSPY